MKVERVIEATVPIVKFVTDGGERRLIDVTPLIRGSWYGELANPSYFSLAEPCDFGWAIGWPDGQAIAPDDLLEFSRQIT